MVPQNSVVHLVAGGMGGTVGAIVTCPLEVVKTRLQSTYANFDQVAVNRQPSAISGIAVAHQHVPNHMGIMKCLKTIWEQEGMRALWKGLGPNLVGVAPSRAIYFYTYANSKHFLEQQFSKKDSSLLHMSAAFCAGFTACTLTNPIWLIKTRIQLDRSQAATGSKFTVLQCMKLVYKESGPAGFYKGITASYYGISETMVTFVIYERLKKAILTRNRELEGRSSDQKTLKDYFMFMAAGACSKSSASVICYPHEVARTRLREPGRKYRHFWQTLRLVFYEEGVRGLYRGLATQMLRQIPNSAIMMATYEGAVYFMGGKTEVSEMRKKYVKKKKETTFQHHYQDRSNRDADRISQNQNARSTVTISGANLASHQAYSSLPLSASGPSNGMITVSTDASVSPKNVQNETEAGSPRTDEDEEEEDGEDDDGDEDDNS